MNKNKTSYLLKIIFLSAILSVQSLADTSSSQQETPSSNQEKSLDLDMKSMNGKEFFEILSNKVTGSKFHLVGKQSRNGTSPCYIDLKAGGRRSSNFQSSIQITKTNSEGLLQIPMSINIPHGVQGDYGNYSDEYGEYYFFQFTDITLPNLKYQITALVGQSDLQLELTVGKKSAHCDVFDMSSN